MQSIRAFHIHVYCTEEHLSFCQQLREKMLNELSVIDGAGPVRDRPIGPHPLPMFEAWFHAEALGEVVLWTLAHRGDLSVLIHPLTGDDYEDHAQHAMWIGTPLKLDLEFLKKIRRL